MPGSGIECTLFVLGDRRPGRRRHDHGFRASEELRIYAPKAAEAELGISGNGVR
jgi:hypothetical protein